MILRLRIGNWRFTFSIVPVVDVVGVNSELPDGNHILMWDFDGKTFWQVHDALLKVQRLYKLPNIYILLTRMANKQKKPPENFTVKDWKPAEKGNYIAYCFKRTPWRKAVEIVASTEHVDWNFFRFSVFRGKFTLRVSGKDGRKPIPVYILKSPEPEDVTIADLKSWVKYETLRKDVYDNIKISLPRGEELL